jgi:hypothetical protein
MLLSVITNRCQCDVLIVILHVGFLTDKVINHRNFFETQLVPLFDENLVRHKEGLQVLKLSVFPSPDCASILCSFVLIVLQSCVSYG